MWSRLRDLPEDHPYWKSFLKDHVCGTLRSQMLNDIRVHNESVTSENDARSEFLPLDAILTKQPEREEEKRTCAM